MYVSAGVGNVTNILPFLEPCVQSHYFLGTPCTLRNIPEECRSLKSRKVCRLGLCTSFSSPYGCFRFSVGRSSNQNSTFWMDQVATLPFILHCCNTNTSHSTFSCACIHQDTRLQTSVYKTLLLVTRSLKPIPFSVWVYLIALIIL
jgi:hypothetical protein